MYGFWLLLFLTIFFHLVKIDSQLHKTNISIFYIRDFLKMKEIEEGSFAKIFESEIYLCKLNY